MAIQIKELSIKVTVQDKNAQSGAAAKSTDDTDKDALVQECVDKVLEILDQKYNDR